MRYYIVAGEASGDLHGSNLMKGLYAEDPEAEVRFWGGDLMLAAAAEAGPGRGALVRHYREGAVMGISDVLGKAGRLLGNVRACKADIAAWRPDAVILIDYPGFNFKIAEYAHKAGFKVFYYIAPKTWASREGRNRKLRDFVDKLFIVFPFEIPYFEQRGIPFVYKGNPLVDAVDSHAYSRPVEGDYIALLAGSRKGEISRMMPVCMEAADRLGCKVVIAGAPARSEADYAPYIAGRQNVELIFGRTYDILKYADAAVLNSGTASLEAALIGTPQVVCWSGSRLTVFVARHIFRVGDHLSFISLGNLIVGREAFRELIQEDFTPDAVAEEVRRLTGDADYRSRMLDDYRDIREALGGTGASRAVAEAMIKEIRKGQPKTWISRSSMRTAICG